MFVDNNADDAAQPVKQPKIIYVNRDGRAIHQKNTPSAFDTAIVCGLPSLAAADVDRMLGCSSEILKLFSNAKPI